MQSNPSKKLSKKTQSGKINREPESVTIEDLSKTQTVLLMFLVAFVTSIITGITVVTLLDQEPQAVTQTINRVVQRTIEKVLPSSEEEIKKENIPIVVNKEEEYINNIAKTSKNIASIFSIDKNDAGVVTEVNLGYGYFVSNEHIVLAGTDLSEIKNDIRLKYNNVDYEIDFVGYSPANFSVVKLKDNTTLPKIEINTVVSLDIDSIKPGKEVTIVYGVPYFITKGIVASVVESKDAPEVYIVTINRARVNDDIGALVIDSSGKFVGLVAESESNNAEILYMSFIENEITKMKSI